MPSIIPYRSLKCQGVGIARQFEVAAPGKGTANCHQAFPVQSRPIIRYGGDEAYNACIDMPFILVQDDGIVGYLLKIMKNTLFVLLLPILVAFPAWSAEREGDACKSLPAGFSEIKANLSLHTKAMTSGDIERAIVPAKVPTSKQFAYRFARLIESIGDAVGEWISQARVCESVNELALADFDEVCEKQAEEFELAWNREKIRSAQDENVRGTMREQQRSLGARIRATCFVELESRLFSPKPSVPRPADFVTQTIRSGEFPLKLTLPRGFEDMTAILREGLDNQPAPGGAVFCERDDGMLLKQQSRGEKLDVMPQKGCISMVIDSSESFDANTKRFNRQKDVDIYRKSGLSRALPYSTDKFRVLNYVRKDVRGVPILSYIQSGAGKAYSLYVFDGNRVWLVMYGGGAQKDHEAALWDALIGGL